MVLNAEPGLLSWATADMFLARFAPDGFPVFARSAGGGKDGGFGLAALPDGRAFVVGSIGSGSGFGRTGPPIVFGEGEANQLQVDDPEAGLRCFIAEYFPYEE